MNMQETDSLTPTSISVVRPDVGTIGSSVVGNRRCEQVGILKTSRKMISSNTGKTKKRCPYCPFTSYYSASLTVHLRRHTGEKPYKCVHCPKVFGDRSNMNSHVRRYHREGKTRKPCSSRPSATLHPSYPGDSSHLLGTTSSEILTIASVYSKDVAGSSSYVTVSSPVNFTNKLRSLSTESSPTMVSPSISRQSFDVLSQKVSRRKPSIVRKQVPTDYLPANENIFTAREENLFTRMNSESQSDEENLHALHTADQVSEGSFSAAEKQENARPPFESNSDCRVSDDDTKSGNLNEMHTSIGSSTEDLYACSHCCMFFKSCVLHTLHMGCHAHDEPFKCNFCGAKCKDAIEFHCHFARGNHNGEL